MNAYFVNIPNEERENILNKHREMYNGYRTINPAPVEQIQPLYVQDFANDKGGIVVNNKGEVKQYTNIGINEARRRKPYLAKDDRDDFDDRESEVIGVDSDIEKQRVEEEEHMCEQCGLKESLCECGSYMEEEECTECWDKGEMEEAEDGGESTIDEIGDALIGSGRLQEILDEENPLDYSDEFEFVDNVITQLIYPYSDEEYHDELFDYIRDVYGEMLFNYYMSEMGDDDDDFGDDDFGDDEYITDEPNDELQEQVNNLMSSELDTPIQKSAYSYVSRGPEQFSDDYDHEHDGYEDDIEKIQNMFDYASQNDNDPDTRDMIYNLNKDMNQEFDGDEPSDNEWDAFNFVSGGPPGVTYHESEDGDDMEDAGDIDEEIDEDLRENFSRQRQLTLEMFQRFNRYN